MPNEIQKQEPEILETPATEEVVVEPKITPEPQAEISLPQAEEISAPVEEPEQPPTEKIAEPPESIESTPESVPEVAESTPEPPKPEPIIQTKIVEKIIYRQDPSIIQKLLTKARATIQQRKRVKLDKIMGLFETTPEITTKQVQKLLRTTKRTARRYFDQLEKENKVIQVGSVGRGVLYIKKS